MTAPAESIVTAIKAQEHDRERVNIFVDGEFAFALTAEMTVQEGVRIGQPVDALRIAELQAKDEASKAVNAALMLLTSRPRAVRELRSRLRQKGFSPAAIDAAIEKVEGWNYVDDDAFAKFWVENREANRPRGRRLLEQELRQKGVDRETARVAIDDANLDEVRDATALAQAKARSYAGLAPDVAMRRLSGFLARKGYSYGVIKQAAAAVLGPAREDEDDGSETGEAIENDGDVLH